MTLVVSVMLASFQLLAQGKERRLEHPTFYRTKQVDGLSIFYKEAGPKDAPVLLLLLTSAGRDGNRSLECPTACMKILRRILYAS
jgi:hypothetical protein